MKPELKTARLTLKPVAASDAEIFSRIVNDQFVRRYLFDDEILGANQVADLIRTSDASFSQKKFGLWLIQSNENQEIIGFTGLWHFFDEAQPQLLYALLPAGTGRGLAAEAARRVVEYAFAELGFDYLDASCDAPNLASQRTAERLGMKLLKKESIDGKPTVFYRSEKIEPQRTQRLGDVLK